MRQILIHSCLLYFQSYSILLTSYNFNVTERGIAVHLGYQQELSWKGESQLLMHEATLLDETFECETRNLYIELLHPL